jgi:hypothetical protein
VARTIIFRRAIRKAEGMASHEPEGAFGKAAHHPPLRAIGWNRNSRPPFGICGIMDPIATQMKNI